MKDIVKIGYILSAILFVFYLTIPNFNFPDPPSDFLQSDEPADTETPLRRAYFTNLTREEVTNYYLKKLKKDSLYGLVFPAYKLNYPPEDARTIIRDQTRSTFLEEAVNPFRESLFINGFEPKESKDAVIVQGKVWRQKIIIRQVVSNTLVRLFIGLATVLVIPLVLKSASESVKDFILVARKKWNFL